MITSITAPGAVLEGPTKILSAFMIHLEEMYLFCDKTFVVRPTSDPKKLKFVKIPPKLVKNHKNTPLGPF